MSGKNERYRLVAQYLVSTKLVKYLFSLIPSIHRSFKFAKLGHSWSTVHRYIYVYLYRYRQITNRDLSRLSLLCDIRRQILPKPRGTVSGLAPKGSRMFVTCDFDTHVYDSCHLEDTHTSCHLLRSSADRDSSLRDDVPPFRGGEAIGCVNVLAHLGVAI